MTGETTRKTTTSHRPVDRALLEILVCPLTKEPLFYDAKAHELVCLASRLAYPIRAGIPIMIPDEARPLSDDDLARWLGRKPSL